MEENIIVIEVLKAAPGKAKELGKALADIVHISRQEEGCQKYELFEPVGEEEEFLVLMQWETLADLRRHESSEHIEKFVHKYSTLYTDVHQTEWKKFSTNTGQ